VNKRQFTVVQRRSKARASQYSTTIVVVHSYRQSFYSFVINKTQTTQLDDYSYQENRANTTIQAAIERHTSRNAIAAIDCRQQTDNIVACSRT
jgi:hypothetical protein